jgi:hypothetical protein
MTTEDKELEINEPRIVKKLLQNLEVSIKLPIFAASEMTNPVLSAWG